MAAPDRSIFGETLRRYRITAGMTQEDLANRAGLSVRGISDLERGARTSPHPHTVASLADALALPATDRADLIRVSRPNLQIVQPTSAPIESNRSISRSFPISPTRILGRDQLLVDVKRLLTASDARLVTLIGPGGVGKTRLAIAVAEAMGSTFAEPVLFADLSAITSTADVMAYLETALGVTSNAKQPPIENVALALGNRELLIVLDNFEQVISAGSEIAALLARVPKIKMLVTSREPLGIRGEHVVPVPTLDLPTIDVLSDSTVLAENPAMALLIERWQQHDFGFRLTPENSADLASICRHLDGLPLALELAAASAGPFDPAQLRSMIERRLPSLVSGMQDAPLRHQRLIDTVVWSYDLLPTAEQRAFRLLSVFTGGFDLDAARAIVEQRTDQSGDIERIVHALFRKSLLTRVESPHGSPRFAMLETIREYAIQKRLDEDEEWIAREAHARWFRSLALDAEQELRVGEHQQDWFTRIDAELPNLLAALHWFRSQGLSAAVVHVASALDEYWFSHYRYRTALEWLEPALAMDLAIDPIVEGWACCNAASAARILGRIDLAGHFTERALRLSESANDPFLRGRALLAQTAMHHVAGDPGSAEGSAKEALAAFQQTAALNYQGLMLVELGQIQQQRDETAAAIARVDEGLTVLRTTGDVWATSMATELRGHLGLLAGETTTAARYFLETVELSRATGDTRTRLGAVIGIARLALALEDAMVAVELLAGVDVQQHRGVGLPAYSRSFVTSAKEESQSRIGKARFQEAWVRGQALPFDDVVRRAAEYAESIIASD